MFSYNLSFNNYFKTINDLDKNLFSEDKLLGWLQKGKWTHYSMWLKKKPYLYIKAINDCVDECIGYVDCAGICEGEAIVDECGTCDSDSTNDCVQDCTGVWGGNANTDFVVVSCLSSLTVF